MNKKKLFYYLSKASGIIFFFLCFVFLILSVRNVAIYTDKINSLLYGEITGIQEYQEAQYKTNFTKVNIFYDVTVKLRNNEKVIFKKITDFSDYKVGDSIKIICTEIYVFDEFFERQYEIVK